MQHIPFYSFVFLYPSFCPCISFCLDIPKSWLSRLLSVGMLGRWRAVGTAGTPFASVLPSLSQCPGALSGVVQGSPEPFSSCWWSQLAMCGVRSSVFWTCCFPPSFPFSFYLVSCVCPLPSLPRAAVMGRGCKLGLLAVKGFHRGTLSEAERWELFSVSSVNTWKKEALTMK